MDGRVIRINVVKGFGFIEGNDKRDYFFHFKDVVRNGKAFRHIEVGNPVTFEPGEGKPGACERAYKVLASV